MINENGQFELLTIDDALEIALGFLTDANAPQGSVEQQIQYALAQAVLQEDRANYLLYQKLFTPQGSDLDLQNPNVPRLTGSISSGYVKLVNDTGSLIVVSAASILTAANGNEYTTASNTVNVASGGGVAYITIYSVESGIDQNLVRNISFTSDYDLTITNPQPFTNARDAETNAQYKTRLIERRTNLASYHATNTAETELKEYYTDAKIYVNSDANDDLTPIPIPSNGYSTVVLTTSGVEAGSEELSNAFTILANRLQFGNSIKSGTTLHSVLSGTVYAGSFPAEYYLIPAQSVQFTLNATLSVSFDSRTSEQEKVDLSLAFSQFFCQNVLNYFGGAAGNSNVTFNPVDPYTAPTVTTTAIGAALGLLQKIAPSFSLEQVRALISDASDLESVSRLKYEACSALAIELDSLVDYEATIDLDINDSYVPDSVDFARNALFSDNTSWFDRYIFIDPALINITINEVSY